MHLNLFLTRSPLFITDPLQQYSHENPISRTRSNCLQNERDDRFLLLHNVLNRAHFATELKELKMLFKTNFVSRIYRCWNDADDNFTRM